MEVGIFLIFSLILGGGQGNDLLSLVPTDAYWKSKDVEVNAANIMLELNSIKPDDTSKTVAVRRLMAIRTLGELKSPDAINSLKSQLESKDMFVADYAQRAIDTIEGKAPDPKSAAASGVPPDVMKKELYLLPEHCGGVAQIRMIPGKAITIAKPKEGEDPPPGPDPRAVMEQMSNSIIYVAEMTGNIRVDGVTMGVSDEIGPEQGFVVFFVRGQWDAEAIKSALQPILTETQTAGDVEFMRAPGHGEALVGVPSNESFVFATGPTSNNIPADDIGAAIKSGKGKFENSTDLIKVIDGIDTKQAIWAAMLVGDNYRQAPQLAPFDSLTLIGTSTGDAIHYEAKGTGKDAAAVASAVGQFNSLITEGKNELNQAAANNPGAQPIVDFFNSIELESDGPNATGTGVMKKLGN